MGSKIQFEEHICKICGKEFERGHNWKHELTSKQYYDRYIKSNSDGMCKVCGKPTFWHKQKFCYDDYCNEHKPIKTPSSYNNREQAIKTCKKHYNGKLNSGAWKTRNRQLDDFENEHNCIRTKKLIQMYGQGWLALKLPRIYMNAKNTFVSTEYLPQIIEYSNTYHNSKVQQKIVDFIKSFYFDEVITNDRQVIKPNELDIVLSKLKLAIEFNGTRWHSIELGTSKDYHLNKSLACRNVGFRLVHIYEFEDLDEQLKLLKEFILGQDNYPKNFNKNNFLETIPTPEIIYQDNKYTIYGAGKMEET